jgi:hypothetical protein
MHFLSNGLSVCPAIRNLAQNTSQGSSRIVKSGGSGLDLAIQAKQKEC